MYSYLRSTLIIRQKRTTSIHDYAILLLKKPIGKDIGYFGLYAVAAEHAKLLEDKEIYIAGYPEIEMEGGEGEEKKKRSSRFEFWEDRGRIIGIDGKKGIIHSQISTYPGFDGSGILSKERGGMIFVIGVYVERNEDSGEICWITQEKLKQILRWRVGSFKEKYKAIIQSKDCATVIKDLNFRGVPMTETGIKTILKYRLNDLEEIDLEGCNLDDNTIETLNNKSDWENLRSLNLQFNQIGETDIIAVVKNKAWPTLEELKLQRTRLNDQSVRLLASNPTWINLKHINLDDNDLRVDGAVAISESKLWTNLETLVLSCNSIGRKGAQAIAGNTIWSC